MYPVLAPLSKCYPRCRGRLPTRYSPVRHSTQDRSPFLVRLACVKHAASVQSEPGSNSPVKYLNKSEDPLFFNRDSDLFNAIKTPEAEAPVSWGPSSTLLTIQFSMIAAPREPRLPTYWEKKKITETPEPVKMFSDVFQRRSSWCWIIVRGPK